MRHHVCLPKLARSRSTLTTHCSAEGGDTRRSHLEGEGDAAELYRFGRASGTQRSLAWGAARLDGSFRVRIAAGRLGSQPQEAKGGGRAVAPPRGAVRPRRHAARLASEHVL